jgi:endonuclease YncB( thermonuclease family)
MPRPRRRGYGWRFWAWACIGYLVLLRSVTASPERIGRQLDVPGISPGPCEVIEVLTGDTFVVRPQGLDSPVVVRLLSTQAATVEQDGEQHFTAAKEFARDFLAGGEVILRLDNHRLDSRGRYLAYLEVDGKLLNHAMLEAGLARFFFFPGNSGSTDLRLKRAQEEAQLARRGIWR